MPPERRPPDDPVEWLNRAKSNLQRAKMAIPGVYLEDLCFDAQQAAEKAVKALLIRVGIPFPHVHDLAVLVSLLESAGEVVSPELTEAARLTRFAVAARYPGLGEPVTEEEYRRAVSIADAVVEWADRRLMGDPGG